METLLTFTAGFGAVVAGLALVLLVLVLAALLWWGWRR